MSPVKRFNVLLETRRYTESKVEKRERDDNSLKPGLLVRFDLPAVKNPSQPEFLQETSIHKIPLEKTAERRVVMGATRTQENV